ncbi:MAG: SAM-dependent methyltransferase [Ruminococcaceae bacterium]|nr:SAM-dependent methyltransferase [Oscillospiraceae bacterium]
MSIESVMTPRLLAISHSVPDGGSLADIGTDHAYIPIYLCQKGRIDTALAMDVRSGPLSRAEENICRYGLCDRIKTRLSDGLSALCEGEADTVVIAGMGGLLIAELLARAPVTAKTYVLQPMTAVPELRLWLLENGFAILDECLAQEGEKLYTIITAECGSMTIEKPVYAYVGKRLLEKRDPLTPVLIDMLLKKYIAAQAGLLRSERPETREKEEHCTHMITSLMQLKKECEAWSL